MEGTNSGSEAVSYGAPRDTHRRRGEILVRCVVVVLARALVWLRVRVISEASKPGRRVVSGSAADEAEKRDKAAMAKSKSMAMTLAMIVIIFQSIIVLKPVG